MFQLYYDTGGKVRIRIICDACNKKIDTLGEGVIIYEEVVGEARPIIKDYCIVHHGVCANDNELFPASEELRNIKEDIEKWIRQKN